jgi:HMG (high mobility group) box
MYVFDSPTTGEIHHAVERSSSPLNFELWNGDMDLSEKDIDEINLAAFETAVSTGIDMDVKKRDRDGTEAPTVSRRWKKPKGMPKRPLSGYNLFFKHERVNVLKEQSLDVTAGEIQSSKRNVSFQDLGKIIGRRWKSLTEEERKKYECMAQQDSVRYRTEMDVFNEMKRKRNEEKDKEAIEGPTEETKESPPTTWSTLVISSPPEIKPLFQHLQPLQARLPGQQQAQALRQSGGAPLASFPTYSQQWQLQHRKASEGIADSTYPIPPGSEVFLPDAQGRERKYQVQYKFYTMTRKAAEAYMEHLASSPEATPYGFLDHSPPAGSNSRYVDSLPIV